MTKYLIHVNIHSKIQQNQRSYKEVIQDIFNSLRSNKPTMTVIYAHNPVIRNIIMLVLIESFMKIISA